MTPKKQVVLFIVEGYNDQNVLAASLEKLLTTDSVKFEVTNGDITSDYSGKNVTARIGDCINKHCRDYGYEKSDIAEAILLVIWTVHISTLRPFCKMVTIASRTTIRTIYFVRTQIPSRKRTSKNR